MLTFPFSSTELIYLVTELGIALLKFAFFIFLTWTIYEHWESSAKRKQNDRRFEAVKDLTFDKFKAWIDTVHGKPSKAQQPSELIEQLAILKNDLKISTQQCDTLDSQLELTKSLLNEANKRIEHLEKSYNEQGKQTSQLEDEFRRVLHENTTLRERFYDYAADARQYVTCYRDQTRFANSSDDWNEENVVADMLDRTDKIMEEFNYLPF